ncbi:acyltransferase family protein [Piscinibacter gummiphilus]|uniref:Acyltransferase family protein n=1 Tax=Piscinibacter gummiphilus TaxID=946333 RepID=A0ABZ0CXA8_9BURK|nr:acyltransferase family protein [Piscinibacter gummiphilus]WOB09156.1 acyltransferase family protein [Piscinibacter gummiphilus]
MTAPPEGAAAPASRLHALDAVRAAALLLGIVLHATLSFIPGVEQTPTLWPIADTQQSRVASLLMYAIHVFRMPVFFLVAGFFAQQLLARRGVAGFVRNRAKRIAGPLAVGWAVCFVAIVAVVIWAVTRQHGGVLPDPLPPFMRESKPNFMHLWFLYLLLWLYSLALLARALWRRVDAEGAKLDALLRRVLATPAGALLLAAPIALALFLTPDWIVILGVPTPGYTLIPPPGPLFVYAYVFALGWALGRQRALLDTLARRWVGHGLLGIAGGFVALLSATTHPGLAPITDLGPKAGYAIAYGIGLTASTLAFVGLGLRFFSKPSPTVRYLADASYWIYIAHLPLVMALQAAVMLSPLHWSIKYIGINVVATALLVASYHLAVRRTWVGLWLNGKRVMA